ncbi:endonuclease domain-containing protein [Blastochloris sulfoviridis]|uniref:endonuclease domain-containing protein n=1 Tax=Blastochloris sulfoviridis TaxID=50712 RepID=UPI0024822170|nr:endonuclease domain-containing protein [Blastochloris sulfoviridis]
MRREMTEAERAMWRLLRDRRLAGAKFRRQVPLGPYVADFLSFDRRLVIEVDGGQHAGSMRDQRREAWFADSGFRTLRFWNNDVLGNAEGVFSRIQEAVQ